MIDFVKTDIINYCLSDNSSKSNVVKKYDLVGYEGDHYFMSKNLNKDI